MPFQSAKLQPMRVLQKIQSYAIIHTFGYAEKVPQHLESFHQLNSSNSRQTDHSKPERIRRARPLAVWCQLAFRGPEICGIDAEEDAGERDLTPRTISNCLRHLEIKPSKRSLMSNSFIKPSIVAGSPISINL